MPDQNGLLVPGNIDLAHRPAVKNPDGTISTVRSMSIGVDGGHEVLIPTVSEDGRVMSEPEAIAQFQQTGRHLGVFRDVPSANAYAQQLHEQQATQYGAAAMPQQPTKYVSTDPDAGLDRAGGTSTKYISTDPHAGLDAHERPDYSGTLNDAFGVMGRAGVMPGLPLSGPLGEAAARYVGNPEHLPALAATIATPFTAGLSIPATMAVSGLAAGAGSIAKNAADYFLGSKRAPATVTDAALDVAKDAGTQAAVTGATGVAGKAAQYAGTKAYGWLGLSPAKPLAEEFGRDAMAREGVALGAIPGTQGGVDRTTAARAASAANTNNLIATANKTAAPIQASEIVPSAVDPAYAELRKRASIGKDVTGDLTYVATRARDLARTLNVGTPGQLALPGGGVDMVVGQARKQAAQGAANAAYARAQAGLPINDVEQMIDKHLGTAYKTALETRAPGIDTANAKTQTLIGLIDALKDTQNRPVILRATAAAPTHGTSLLTLPTVAGAGGIGLDRLGRLLQQLPSSPTLVRDALLQMMGGDQPPQPPLTQQP